MAEQVIKTDATTKVLLTVIAILLGVIAVGQLSNRAEAQGSGCGTSYENYCWVRMAH